VCIVCGRQAVHTATGAMAYTFVGDEVPKEILLIDCTTPPLISAAAAGHQRSVELLLDAGADVGIAMTAAEEDIGGGAGHASAGSGEGEGARGNSGAAYWRGRGGTRE
jgi:hypothetical protein